MKRLLALLALLLPLPAFAVNPAIGIHNLSGYIFPATTYTSATGFNSSASGSSFVVMLTIEFNQASTVTDNFSNTYSLVSLGSGTNPIEDVGDGIWTYIYACTTSCTGGTNHEVTVTNAGSKRMYSVAFAEITNTNTIDAAASAYSSAGSPLNISVTTTVANDLVYAVTADGSGSGTVTSGTGSGFTNLDSGAYTIGSLGNAYQSAATTGSYNAAMKSSNSGHKLIGFTLALKPSAGPTTSPSQFFLGASLWQRPVSLEAMAR